MFSQQADWLNSVLRDHTSLLVLNSSYFFFIIITVVILAFYHSACVSTLLTALPIFLQLVLKDASEGASRRYSCIFSSQGRDFIVIIFPTACLQSVLLHIWLFMEIRECCAANLRHIIDASTTLCHVQVFKRPHYLLGWWRGGSPNGWTCGLNAVVSSRAGVPRRKPASSGPWPRAACRTLPPCCRCPAYCSSPLSSHCGRFRSARRSAAFVCRLWASSTELFAERSYYWRLETTFSLSRNAFAWNDETVWSRQPLRYAL